MTLRTQFRSWKSSQAIPKKKKVKFFEQTDEEKAFLKKIQKDSSDEGSSEDN